MQFQNAIITEQGVRIFQAALANNPVVFTKCLFSGSATPLTASMVALPEPTWGNGHVTNYAANDSGGDFIIYASATNATDYGYAYGYGIYGYLQNEGIENEKLLVVANYDGNVTYVSEASGPYTRFHFAITIKLSMAAGVLSIAPHYNDLVSDAAFQNLANRTVTTHSALSEEVGDNQTILGQKIFRGHVWCSNSARIGGDENGEATMYIENDEQHGVQLYTEYSGQHMVCQFVPKLNGDDSNNSMIVGGTIQPKEDGIGELGRYDCLWLMVHAYHVSAKNWVEVNGEDYHSSLGPGGVEFQNDNSDSLGYIGLGRDDRMIITGDDERKVLVTSPGLEVDGDLNVTGAFNSASLNITSATISHISSTTIATQGIDATGIITTTLNAASMTGNSATIGNISATTMTAQGIDATGVDATTAEIDSLSATNATISALTIGGISFNRDFSHPALIENDRQDEITEIPVGSIFLAYIVVDPDDPSSKIKAGGITNTITLIRTIRLVPIYNSLEGVRYMTIEYGSEFHPTNAMDFQVLNNTPRSGGIALVMRTR